MAISEVKAKFDSLSTPKKVAVVAGGAAAVAAGAIAATAAVRTGKINFVNGANKMDTDTFNKMVEEIGADSKWGKFKKTVVDTLGDKKAGFVDGLKSIFTKEGRAAYKTTAGDFSTFKNGFFVTLNKAKEAAAEAAKATAEKASEVTEAVTEAATKA